MLKLHKNLDKNVISSQCSVATKKIRNLHKNSQIHCNAAIATISQLRYCRHLAST